MNFKTLHDFDVSAEGGSASGWKDKRVLVRCDFNVPLDMNGSIVDNFKIQQTLPTIQYLIDKEAKVILMSHLDPENTGFVSPEFTLEHVKDKLSEYLSIEIKKTDDCIGKEAKKQVEELKNGEVLLLENLRFHKGETDNTEEFAKKLAELGDIFINDAFAECHRAYASIVGIPKFLPRGAGLLLEKEIKNLSSVLKNPKRPFLVLVGGAKVKTKVTFLENISKIADTIIISGPIKQEMEIENIDFENEDKLIFPLEGLEDLDVSDKTLGIFLPKILEAKTIIWNGPFGRIEDEEFQKGTLKVANAIIESGAFSVVGGGSTVEFLNKEGIISKFSHVSTGGGAMLDYLSGDKLPGIEAIED